MILTTTAGFTKARIPRGGRNKYLIPEATLRSKRILSGAAEEMKVAIEYYDSDVEYYSRLKNGVQCTCQQASVDREVVEAKTDGASLSDFLLSLNQELPNQDYCPICFGTTFVGGYKRLGADTIILDASSKPRPYRCNLVKERPYYYKPTNKLGHIEWQITVPKYFSAVLNIAIKWKEEPEQWDLKIDGSTITKSLLESLKGDKVTIRLEMKDSTNENAGFYAAFIQLAIVNDGYIRCDSPRNTISYTGEINVVDEVQSSITINFSDIGYDLSSRDLVIDNNGIIWRLLEIEYNNPLDVTISYTCQARLVRAYETYFQLPSKILQKHYNENLYTFIV